MSSKLNIDYYISGALWAGSTGITTTKDYKKVIVVPAKSSYDGLANGYELKNNYNETYQKGYSNTYSGRNTSQLFEYVYSYDNVPANTTFTHKFAGQGGVLSIVLIGIY